MDWIRQSLGFIPEAGGPFCQRRIDGQVSQAAARLAINSPPTKRPPASDESQNLTDPIDCQALELHWRRRRTPDREIGVQRRSKQIGECSKRIPGRLDITKHPGMRVLTAKRNDRVAKNFQQRIKICSFDRKRRVERTPNLA